MENNTTINIPDVINNQYINNLVMFGDTSIDLVKKNAVFEMLTSEAVSYTHLTLPTNREV